MFIGGWIFCEQRYTVFVYRLTDVLYVFFWCFLQMSCIGSLVGTGRNCPKGRTSTRKQCTSRAAAGVWMGDPGKLSKSEGDTLVDLLD